jgi:hypothetical protein
MQGFVMLTAPRHGTEVRGIELLHYLFDLKGTVRSERLLWWDIDVHYTRKNLIFDEVLRLPMDSEFGPLEVTFAIYCPGAEASLHVSLVNHEKKNLTGVYGHMKVKNDRVHDPRGVSWLFKKAKREEDVCVSGGLIEDYLALPLLKHAVVVPLNSKMIVDVRICYGDMVFVSGELSFDSMLTGKESKVLENAGIGEIKVEVSWGFAYHDEMTGYCW